MKTQNILHKNSSLVRTSSVLSTPRTFISRTLLLISVTVQLLLLSTSNVVEACFASGICGGGCLPPAPPPCVPAQCGVGYGCGQYGCYKLRARVASSKTLKLSGARAGGAVDEFEGSLGVSGSSSSEQRQLDSPDSRFMACCQSRQLPDPCLNKCSFGSFTQGTLQRMFFRADPCPMQAAADMQFCAAQGRDHTECCIRNGVANTLSGTKCLTFCNQVPGNVTQLDFSYLSCYERFENMKGCFWHDLTRRISTARHHH